jgi:hypothetical protein
MYIVYNISVVPGHLDGFGKPLVGNATVFVSHAWKYMFVLPGLIFVTKITAFEWVNNACIEMINAVIDDWLW